MKNRILVAEDDPIITNVITLNLDYSGYDFQAFENGSDVVAQIALDHQYDIALLDIMLPGLDGFELLQHMNQFHIPVIFLTARTDLPTKLKGLRDGAEDYITKPFEVLELLVRIEKILQRQGKLEKSLMYKDYFLDLNERRIFCSGDEVHLKPLEFDLFAILVKYKNRTLLRERLLNEIWGIDYFGGTRTVDVHIAQLRKKLGLYDEIKTIPKIGYRLEDM